MKSSHGQSGPAQHELAHRPSLTIAYEFWLNGWEAVLLAIAAAAQSKTLTTTEAAAHKVAIAAERELVTKHVALLLADARSPAASPQS